LGHTQSRSGGQEEWAVAIEGFADSVLVTIPQGENFTFVTIEPHGSGRKRLIRYVSAEFVMPGTQALVLMRLANHYFAPTDQGKSAGGVQFIISSDDYEVVDGAVEILVARSGNSTNASGSIRISGLLV
jgi:hypothetical protein